jgi:outer membrane protein assembly factor BamB
MLINGANFIFAKEIELLWRQPLGGTAASTPQVQLQSIVVLCDDGGVRAFGSSGRDLWEYKSVGRLAPFIARSRTAISFVCGNSGDLTAVNRAGRVLWTIELKEKIVAPPLSGWDERIFVFLEKKIVCCTETASLLWQQPMPAAIAIEPVLDNSGGFITVLADSTLITVTAFGKVSAARLNEMPLAALPLSGKSFHVTNGNTNSASRTVEKILLVNPSGSLKLYEYDENELREAGGAIISLPGPPIAATSLKNLAAIQLNNGKLVLLQTDENKILWNVESNPGIGAPGNRAQKINVRFDRQSKNIYVLSISGAAAFSVTGEELWSARIEGAAATPALSDEGILYSSGRDWILYAYNTIEKTTGSGILELPPIGDYGLGKRLSENELSQLKLISGSDYEFILEVIHDAVLRGNLGEHEPLWIRTLFAIADDKDTKQEARITAVRILGVLGSRETIPFLNQLLRNEKQNFVQAEIVNSLGKIGVDRDGMSFFAFTKIISARGETRNDTLLFSVTKAIGNICRFSGPPLSERGIELLTLLARDPSRLVSQQARDELELLRK